MTPADAAERAFATAIAIQGAKTLVAIQAAVRALAAPLGYDRFVLFSASAARDEVVDTFYWLEGDWFGDGTELDAQTYLRRCPVSRHMLSLHEPFFWTKTGARDKDLYRVVRTPQGVGVHGLQVPVFGPLGLEGAMSLGGERIDASAHTKLALSLVGQAAFLAARKLLEMPVEEAMTALSDREREVLAWTAAGRRQTEIAETLGLSERTVENHLRRVRRRLGVATTAQAVRVAIRNGEIAA